MILRHYALAAALILPLGALSILTAYRQYVYANGQDVILPISAFDPRDLLSGRYLAYQIDYGIHYICQPPIITPSTPAIVCLNPKKFNYGETPSQGCTLFIRGTCKPSGFIAGIERYYIPEGQGSQLEKEVQSKKGSVLLSVTRDGHAMVKDILIDGKSWKTPKAP